MGATERGEAGLREAFLATDIHVWIGRQHLVVRPLPVGETVGSFPSGAQHLHVVTAWNPMGQRADPTANARADRALRAELAALDVTTWDAEGWAPDDRWAEESVAVLDAGEHTVLELARRYRQAAIYRWTPTERAVVWTDGRPDDVQGWAVEEVTPAGGPAPRASG